MVSQGACPALPRPISELAKGGTKDKFAPVKAFATRLWQDHRGLLFIVGIALAVRLALSTQMTVLHAD